MSHSCPKTRARGSATRPSTPRLPNRTRRTGGDRSPRHSRCARSLCLLRDSAVLFREPPASRSRLLVVKDGLVVEARDLEPGEAASPSFEERPLFERRLAFDRGHYDRLRTLTTELKRVLRD